MAVIEVKNMHNHFIIREKQHAEFSLTAVLYWDGSTFQDAAKSAILTTMKLAWSQDKAASNRSKHNISFEEASTIFVDPLSLVIDDPLPSDQEERFILMGMSARQRLLVVVHTETEETIRIISARLASAHERKQYEQGT